MGDDAIRVLHVDDDPALLDLTETYLEREDDLVVESAANADAGLKLIETEPIDCLVSDYDMPRTDGLEFFEGVRDAGSDVPFILFTGHGNETVASEAISMGVTDYLRKGTGTEQYDVLANRIRNYVEQHRTEREMRRIRHRREVAGRLASDVIFEWDAEADAFTFAHGAWATLGVELPSEADTLTWWRSRVHPDDREEVLSTLADAVAVGETEVSIDYRLENDAGEYRFVSEDRHYEYDDDGDVGRIIGAARDVTTRRERERRLEALHAASRDLMTAESAEEIAAIASRAAAEVLDLPINAVFERDGDVIRPMTYTDRAAEVIGDIPSMERGSGLMWDAIDDGEVRAFADLGAVDNVYNPNTAIRSELAVPIEGFGVFVAASTTTDDFDQVDVAVAKVLISHVEATLERLDDGE